MLVSALSVCPLTLYNFAFYLKLQRDLLLQIRLLEVEWQHSSVDAIDVYYAFDCNENVF